MKSNKALKSQNGWHHVSLVSNYYHADAANDKIWVGWNHGIIMTTPLVRNSPMLRLYIVVSYHKGFYFGVHF